MSEKRRCKGNMYCCVPQCKSYYYENVSFHTFPTADKALRAKWIHKLKIAKNVTPFMKVCSKHFRDEDYFFNKRIPCKAYRLKKNTIPSLNLPKDKPDLHGTLIQGRNKRKNNLEKFEVNCDIAQTQAQLQEEAVMSDNDVEEEAQAEIVKEFIDKGIQVNTYEEFNQVDISDIINTENKLRILTGVQNFALLGVLVQYLSKLIKEKSECDCTKLILLTLMHIKLDIPLTVLSALFNISHTSAQNYFENTVKNLASVLETVIVFPRRDENPKFPHMRLVLSCTKIEVQKSYESEQTVKFLIATAPSGLIIFLSKVYGGRMSDKAIFNKENLISKLCSGDTIMVDKGFLIDKECAEQNIKLIRPAFVRNKRQFDKSEAIKTAEMARVHVERVFHRIKLFRIFRNVLPFKMLPHINNIVTIIAALTNLKTKPVLLIENFS